MNFYEFLALFTGIVLELYIVQDALSRYSGVKNIKYLNEILSKLYYRTTRIRGNKHLQILNGMLYKDEKCIINSH